MRRFVHCFYLAALTAAGGCHKQQEVVDPRTQAVELKKAFPAVRIESSTNKTYAQVPVSATLPDGQPNVDFYVGAAVNAMEANDHMAAFKFFQFVQKQTNMNAEQLMAVHDAVRNYQQTLIRRANSGDKAALAAIEEINRRPP